MPGKVKVKIIAGRNLPVMDRSADTTDAYVEVKLGNTTFKTDVCRKSLNPQWSSEWYRFEVDDSELQDEPLQIRLMDYDVYSANDAIGKVYVDLNPLLMNTSGRSDVPESGGPTANSSTSSVAGSVTGSAFAGWVPVFDTMHGIRGEVHLLVKVELFSDSNKFRQSSCGVPFFYSPTVPFGYQAQVIHGFVEELVINDDPEYQWIDKIRTPRASNEARQTLFFKLSGEVQRRIGLKVLEMGGNAVIGYHKCFDLEGESGIVVRGIGTAVTLVRQRDIFTANATDEESAIYAAASALARPSSCSCLLRPSGSSASMHGGDRTRGAPPPPPFLLVIPPTPTGAHALSPTAGWSPILHDFPGAAHRTQVPFLAIPRPPFPAAPGPMSLVDRLTAAAGDPRHQPTLGETDCSMAKLSPSKLISTTCTTIPGLHRRSSDSDLSITPKGSSLGGSSGSAHARHALAPLLGMPRAHLTQESSLDMMEYPFLTMSKYPPGFIVKLGGMVSSRSVKLLERTASAEDHESRDVWWNELRMEVRSHARALACNVVLGYREHSSICEDVCVLSASGTAAVMHVQPPSAGIRETKESAPPPPPPPLPSMHNPLQEHTDLPGAEEKVHTKSRSFMETREDVPPLCSLCHVPYSTANAPMPVNSLKCAICRQGKVPDILLTTIEPPDGLLITGRGSLIQAHVFRSKRDCRGELNAKEISDGLPFLEYELHRALINKLRVKGMNAVFNLKVQVSIGERWLVGVATGTAMFLSPMPAPPLPRVVAGEAWCNKAEIAEMQKRLQETSKRNREQFCVQPFHTTTPLVEKNSGESNYSESEESDEDLPDLELTVGNKDVYVLEVDDAEDVNVVALLIEPRVPEGFDVVNTELVPGQSSLEIVCNLQMFTQVWRARINPAHGAKSLSKHFHRLQQSLYFKLRKMIPCALCHMDFNVELPEPDEIQITVLGMALGLADPVNQTRLVRQKKESLVKKSDESEMIFKLDDDSMHANPPPLVFPKSSILRGYHTAPRERYGVDITPLSYVPGARIDSYLGNLNFFFIRESTTIRECGGLSGFVHSFVAEVLAIVRAHVTALGGNAMVAYFLSECVLLSSSHKNQGQCLINVGGDIVHVVYAED